MVTLAWSVLHLLTFYFANYFAHAATVVTFPGQSALKNSFVVASALVVPGSGLMRAAKAILRRASLVKNGSLKQAARAGALCMVVKRSKIEEPTTQALTPRMVPSEENSIELAESRHSFADSVPERQAVNISDSNMKNEEGILPMQAQGNQSPSERISGWVSWWECSNERGRVSHLATINGGYYLPLGYVLNYVPFDACIEFANSDGYRLTAGDTSRNPVPVADAVSTQPITFASTRNVPKILVSLIQTIWASITLYRARGDQVDEYRYAAFGLTVAPYAFMSLVNVVANLLTPQNSALFLVRTPIMGEADAEGGLFSGEIRVEIDYDSPTVFAHGKEVEMNASFWLAFCLSLITPAIVGALSHFRPANSTSLQRGFVMAWLVLGIFFGVLGRMSEVRKHSFRAAEILERFAILFTVAVIGSGAIGGMVVVGI